jgi:hypothetical protein
MDATKHEILPPNVLSLAEHVEIIQSHQFRMKEAIFDFVGSVRLAFDQLGPEVFDRDLARELRMSASTLNRWKSIGSSVVVIENKANLPPVFSSLYEVTLLEKLYVEEKGEAAGRAELQKLISRGSIAPTTETKDIKFYVDRLKRERLEKKRNLKEKLLFEHEGAVGYASHQNYRTLTEAVVDGAKFRTIVAEVPKDLLTKWADPGFLKSDIQRDFPLSELRGRSENQSITCLLKVPNHRIDVAIKILQASGFSYRRTFFNSNEPHDGRSSVVVFGERGAASSTTSVGGTELVDLARRLGASPYLILFDACFDHEWVSIKEPMQ